MLQVFGAKVSYFTGKLEAYLRYKGIPYETLPAFAERKAIVEETGAMQIPIVRDEDGRWMSDTTPILQYLETKHPSPSILPADPVVRFLALLIEDYADEWLWRPAMHYRWSYRNDRALLSSLIVDELAEHVPLPRWMKRLGIQTRQRVGFVIRDGVNAATWDHVEGSYFAALEHMSTMLAKRSFLLGDAPSVADFGLMGPMLRHFGQDPTPAELMRTRGSKVYAWVARVWNTHGKEGAPRFFEEFPADGDGLLREICETHLEQLRGNAAAWTEQRRRFALAVQGCFYKNLPVSRYRVACLERLRQEFAALDTHAQSRVRERLPYSQAEILWDSTPAAVSGYDEERLAPFNKAINVYGRGVPW